MYLKRWRHRFHLLVENLFHTLAHSDDDVVRPIERETVRKDESNVGNKLVSFVITRVLRVGIRFRRV